jgi:sulfur transfer protein SufE
MKINSKVTKYQRIIFFKKKAKKFKDEIRKQNKKIKEKR